MSGSELLDTTALERLRRLGDENFVRSMIDLFFSFVGDKLTEARAALASGDLNRLAGAAHAVKSTAANAGACRVRDLAVQLEQVAKAGQGAQARELFTGLEQAYAEVTPLLEVAKAKLNKNDT